MIDAILNTGPRRQLNAKIDADIASGKWENIAALPLLVWGNRALYFDPAKPLLKVADTLAQNPDYRTLTIKTYHDACYYAVTRQSQRKAVDGLLHCAEESQETIERININCQVIDAPRAIPSDQKQRAIDALVRDVFDPALEPQVAVRACRSVLAHTANLMEDNPKQLWRAASKLLRRTEQLDDSAERNISYWHILASPHATNDHRQEARAKLIENDDADIDSLMPDSFEEKLQAYF